MKCPHCHKNIKLAPAGARTKETKFIPFDFTGLFVRNLIIWLIPYGLIINVLDNYTSWPISMNDGLAINYWLIPMIIIGIGLGIYCLLYEYNKVKGRFLFKG